MTDINGVLNLTDFEFCNLRGSCTPDLTNRLLNNNIALLNVLPNPDKHDERDSYYMLSFPCSEYFEISKLNKILNSSCNSRSSLTLLHCNIRSLSTNLPLSEDFLFSLDTKPDIFATSETKLNSRTITNNDIPHYQFFFHTDSETAAGGAALHKVNNLNVIPR